MTNLSSCLIDLEILYKSSADTADMELGLLAKCLFSRIIRVRVFCDDTSRAVPVLVYEKERGGDH